MTLTLHVASGPIRTGLWCERCLLPSVVEVDLFWLRTTGVTRLGTYRECLDERTR